MVVPPDYHDDQRLVTHKLRVSGCDVDTERSYDTFGNVVLDLSAGARRARGRVHELDRRRAGGGRDGASTPALAPDARFASHRG